MASTPEMTAANTPPAPDTAPPADNSFSHVLASWLAWWRTSVVGTVDQSAVIEKRRAECSISSRYLLMLAMSAGIAMLGLLLSSPAVVIGAMLLSPLMDPIIGLGFGLAVGDFGWTKQSAKSLAVGTLLSVLFCAAIVFMSPIQTITPEIAARIRPNLFDLFVALFSAIAGAYAMIRGREGTVVGVAIATALMPPLAVVGFGLATANGTVFWGALLLYFTNLMTIALTAAIMARLYGFRTSLSERNTALQYIVIVVAFIGLAIPLFISLRQIAWETQAQRVIRQEVMAPFDDSSRLSDIAFNWETDPIVVEATVLTPQLSANAEQVTERRLSQRMERPIDVALTQYQVGTAAQAAEQAEVATARAQEQASAARADELAARLAIVAGVDESDVLVDRQKRRALVTARPLDGATLIAYRDLENRISATEPEWTVELRPPARTLPQVSFDADGPDDAGVAALGLIEWAGKRVGAPVVLIGGADNVAAIAELLGQRGLNVRTETRGNGTGPVTARWAAPEQ
ncbi:TIGR00341 family protein [Altererythrobacter sp. CAU 1778]